MAYSGQRHRSCYRDGRKEQIVTLEQIAARLREMEAQWSRRIDELEDDSPEEADGMRSCLADLIRLLGDVKS